MTSCLLVAGGRPFAGLVKGVQSISREDLPVAVIKDASSGQQRVWTATVATVVAATAGEPLSPCIVVVGRVVAERRLSRSWDPASGGDL